MKRIYIKPETKEIECSTISIIAASTQETQWNMNENGETSTNIPDGEGQDPDADPDPNAGAKIFNGFLADDWNVDFNYDY